MSGTSRALFRSVFLLAFLLTALAACRRTPGTTDDLDLFRREDPFFSKFIEPDETLLWRLRPGEYRAADLAVEVDEPQVPREELPDVLKVTASGLRGKEASEKRSDVRVLCLGDSTTFGYRTPYPELLEEMLSEGLWRRVEVLNAGVPGYSVAQGRKWFDEALAALKPDYVVALFGWNDFKDALRGYTDETLLGSRLKRWFAARRITFAALPNIYADPLSEESGCCRVRAESFAAHYRAISEKLGTSGRLVALSYPVALEYPEVFESYPEPLRLQRMERLAGYTKRLETAAREGGFEVVDLRGEIRSGLGLGYFRAPQRDPVHPSAAGAREIARVAARRLMELQKH